MFFEDGPFVTFPIQKWEFLFKIKEIKRFYGGGPSYAAQAIPPIDAEIGQKDHLRMETKYRFASRVFIPLKARLL